MANNIILIGFMGSGKSTLSDWIKNNYNKAKLDTDDYIVELEKRSINEIFATDGEEYFRKLETSVLKRLLDDNITDTIISVGGGLPIKEENGMLLKKLGKVVYLKAGVDVLVNRLKNDKSRPLLQGGELKEKIENLMQKREKIYEDRADLIIDTTGLSLKEIYNEICKN